MDSVKFQVFIIYDTTEGESECFSEIFVPPHLTKRVLSFLESQEYGKFISYLGEKEFGNIAFFGSGINGKFTEEFELIDAGYEVHSNDDAKILCDSFLLEIKEFVEKTLDISFLELI
jgi:hypothetical protein